MSDDAYEFQLSAHGNLICEQPSTNVRMRIVVPMFRYRDGEARVYTTLPLLALRQDHYARVWELQ